jgi:ubiquitin-like protein ATG12
MSGPPSPQPLVPDDEDADADLPLTMAASVVLTALPRDAKSALEGAGELVGVEKGV